MSSHPVVGRTFLSGVRLMVFSWLISSGGKGRAPASQFGPPDWFSWIQSNTSKVPILVLGDGPDAKQFPPGPCARAVQAGDRLPVNHLPWPAHPSPGPSALARWLMEPPLLLQCLVFSIFSKLNTPRPGLPAVRQRRQK